MGSKEAILAAVKRSQPTELTLQPYSPARTVKGGILQFRDILESIGGKAYVVHEGENVAAYLEHLFPQAKRILAADPDIGKHFIGDYTSLLHHSLSGVDVAVIKVRIGVAENGAVWTTEEDLRIRVLPFICEHLVALVQAEDIVATMHDAYLRIDTSDYGFGVFIAGPSKTADIEQSLVLGAHGPKSMTVLIKVPKEALAV